MGLGAAFRIPKPNEKVEEWHVSPLVDLCAYSLSWAWVLIPLVLLGPTRKDYLYLDRQIRERYPARFWLFPLVLAAAWAASPWLDGSELVLSTVSVCALAALAVLLVQILRRDGGPDAAPAPQLAGVLAAAFGSAALLHLGEGLLGIELEGAWWWFAAALACSTWLDVRRRLPEPAAASEREVAIAVSGGRRFTSSWLIVALMGVALLAGPWIEAHQVEGGVPVAHVLAFVGAFAALWNFWHVYMQKYGIMRMYNAKARGRFGGDDPEVPGWADKSLLLVWLPLYFAYLGPLYRQIAVDYFDDASAVLPRFIDLLEQAMPVTLPVTVGLVILVHGLWLRAEWRANRLRSRPRLAMVLGTTALALSFFVFDPVKVYLAFAFSHALEYCVFVWAYQRKRYQAPLADEPILGRMLRRPVLFYLGMIALFGLAILLLKYWGRYIVPEAERPELLGYRTSYWLGLWGIYQSMAHFYFDGFLWKMRLPSVRANL